MATKRKSRQRRPAKRRMPPQAYADIPGLEEADRTARAVGVTLVAHRTTRGWWEILFTWRGQKFGDFRPDVGTLIIAGQKRYVETIGAAVDAVVMAIDPSRPAAPAA